MRLGKGRKLPEEIRMIHVRIAESTHKSLRIRVAELDTSIQDWVAGVIEKNLKSAKKRSEGS